MPRLPGLDGLRAIAVISVVLYHLPVSWLPGGFLGVDVFFVLSGYLITSLLTAEATRSGTIALGQFWLRRARRLFPALAFMLLVVVAVTPFVARDAVSLLRTDLLPALGYITNWWLTFHHVSYFQAIGRPPLLLHLWSLAVEEQFYLVWPLVVFAVVCRGHRTKLLGCIALGGAVASSIWMGFLFHPYHDPSRTYFGTDSHAGGLLLGAAISVAFPPWGRRAAITTPARRVLDAVGLAALGGLIYLMVALNEYGASTYRGGLQGATVLTAVLILICSHPATLLPRVLSWAPINWIGRRSYAIYLWHWPIFELTRPHQDVPFGGAGLLVLRLGATLAMAEISYWLVERPFQTGKVVPALRKLWERRRSWALATSGATVCVCAALTVSLVTTASPEIPAALAAGSTPAADANLSSVKGYGEHLTAPPAGAPTSPTTGATTTLPPVTTVPPPTVMLTIGDSVMLDAAADLQAKFGPSTVVDAVVGRQVSLGIERLQEYKTSGRLATFNTLVIGLGTNGPMSPSQCNDLLSVAASVPHIIMVNVRVPRSWQSTTNDTLAHCTAGQPHVTLVDWYDAAGAPGILGPDRIHSSSAGAALYTSLIAAAVATPTPATPPASQAPPTTPAPPAG